MPRFALPSLAFALSLAALGLAACSGSDANHGFDPTTESVDFISAGSDLVGRYADGTGDFESLSLARVLEGEKLVNRYEAKQRVKCVRAPCPPIDAVGRWAVRGPKLILYPEGLPSTTYDMKLTDTTLTLLNESGFERATLKRVMPIPSDRGDGETPTP
jgi:hypothetical protein